MRKHRRKNRKPLLIVLVTLLLLVGTVFALEKTGITNLLGDRTATDTTADSGPTEEEIAAEAAVNAENKQRLIDEEKANQPDTNQPPSDSPSDDPSRSIELSARQEDNGSVTVFTRLYGYSSGSCTLTVTHAGKTNTQSAAVVYQPEYSTCAGFSVPTAQLGTGTWNINLKVNSNGATTTKDLSFKVN